MKLSKLALVGLAIVLVTSMASAGIVGGIGISNPLVLAKKSDSGSGDSRGGGSDNSGGDSGNSGGNGDNSGSGSDGGSGSNDGDNSRSGSGSQELPKTKSGSGDEGGNEGTTPPTTPTTPLAPIIGTPEKPVAPLLPDQPPIAGAVKDGKKKTPVLPYCDTPAGKNAKACFDRKDFDDKTGLYPCNDGTQKKDYRDCKDASKFRPGPPTACQALGCPGNPPDPNKGCFGNQRPGRDGLCHFPPHPPGPCIHREKSGICFPFPPGNPCSPDFRFRHDECIKKIVIDIHTHNSAAGSSGSQSLTMTALMQ